MTTWAIPDSWKWKALGDPSVCRIIMGQSPPGRTYNEDGQGLPFFQGKTEFGEIFPTARKWCTDPRKVSLPGDVLVSVRAPVGPTNLTPFECIIGRGLAALRPSDEVDSRYLLYVLRRVEGKIASKGTGSTFSNISMANLSTVEVPIAPLAEQRRIVGRIEALMGEVREMRRLQEEIADDVGQFMNACIQEVFGHKPSHWQTDILSDVAHIQTGVAKGGRYRNARLIEVPYLRVANVQAGYLDLEEIKSISIPEDRLDRYRLKTGDLLLTEGGDYDKLGRGAIWEGQIDPCIHQNHIFAVRFQRNRVLSKFAEYEMQSRYAKDYFLGVAKKTTNLASINKSQLSGFPIRYPPDLTEQEDIVAQLDGLFVGSIELAESSESDRDLLEQLEQAILAQAFRGEL